MKKLSILLLCLLSAAVTLQAQVDLDKVGQSTMNFQLVTLSPRAAAMGAAFVAARGGAESIFYNPAAIRSEEAVNALAFYSTRWIADIDYMAMAVTRRLGAGSTLGFHILSVDYGEIRHTRLISPDEIEEHPLGYVDLGTMDNVGASSIGLSLARSISTQFSIGLTARLSGQNLGRSDLGNGLVDNSLMKTVFDAGVHYSNLEDWLHFAMSIRNFSSNAKRELIYEQLPLLFTMGLSLNAEEFLPLGSGRSLLLTADFQHPNNFSERLDLGMELGLDRWIFLRGGYRFNRDLESWTLGAGLNTDLAGRALRLDYAFAAMDVFSAVNRFSLTLEL